MMSLWDALRMNMMISYQELVRTFPKNRRLVLNEVKPNVYRETYLQIFTERPTPYLFRSG
ncbi:hypothetical protein C6B42_19445 [Aeromonas caviae]|nr:hypothetical protein C6B42_19445 [Aeromonas caviae]